MRRVINKLAAIRIIVLLLTLVAVLSIWPFRVWTAVSKFHTGGAPAENSELIRSDDRLLQKFVIQYDKLSSIDLYVSEMSKGRYITVSILDENASELFRTYVDTAGFEIPGYVNVPVELTTTVGKEYYLSVSACRSQFTVGYEDIPYASGYVGSLYLNYVEIPARHLNAIYSYRLPVSKSISLIAIMGFVVFAITFLIVADIYYKKRPEKNTISTVERACRFVANPLAAVFFTALMIMVFPLRLFDLRVGDIVFYEIGLLIAAAIVFYGINHRVVKYSFGISFWNGVLAKERKTYIFMMASIAMAIWYASAYMNDLYDIYHTISERRMIICLLVLIILTFSVKQALSLINLFWVILSIIVGVNYYKLHALAITEKEYDLHNIALKLAIAICILSGLVVINLISEIYARIRDIKKNDNKLKLSLSRFGAVLILFFASIIVFRNTRVWGISLVLTFSALYLRLYFWKGTKNWYKILSGGLMLNFMISLLFSLCHRYFAGFVSGRFAFIFHTVTVTAEYLTFMAAAATVMLTIKIVAFPGTIKVVELFKSAWKEMVLFGFIMAYAIFTVSRTAYLAIAVSVIAVMAVAVSGQAKKILRIIAAMALSVIICFPAAFTMQRIVPVIAANPVFYAIDDTDPSIRGGASWDSTNFMCVERFISLFSSKIFGLDTGSYEYPIDVNNYNDDGTPIYDENGDIIADYEDSGRLPFETEPVSSDLLLAANGFTRAEYHMLLSEMNGYVDENNKLDVVSNGRITIFRSYLKELNLTGHETMGALLPNGEIAVHAHNTYIQVAYDNGLISGGLFVLLLVSALIGGIRLYKKNEKKEPLTLIAFAMTIGFMVAGMTEWVFHFCNPMTVALLLSFAGMVYRERKYE
ncbi:O-antigen ligase family protein [Butyrivibrio sp. YAB3001]|uniref:O-antigen ligase family protein n=1 Tax=Butyrivibrio sp. YAB3001 TaxID=1520812 RepID=UPI0008F63F72|nr:hypothetical protein [Butyrivibrio sp. YAB3001]SFC76339.1 hypothetical protein SAMN02910398_03077 [Butyrivibrio sp. YAB3001]